MPRGDGTGPLGMGPRTGCSLGFCAGFGVPASVNPGLGAGLGWGFGRGRGFRRMHCMSTLPGRGPAGSWAFGRPAGTDKDYLNRQVEFLENQLEQAKKRLQELDEEKE